MKLLDVYRKLPIWDRIFRIVITAAYLLMVGWYGVIAITHLIAGDTWRGITYVVACTVFACLLVWLFRIWMRADRNQITFKRVECPADDAVTMSIPVVHSSQAISPEHYAMIRALEDGGFAMHRGEDGDWYDSNTGEKLPIQDGDR